MGILTARELEKVNFPSLGALCSDWVEAHCVVPDGFSQGEPFVHSGWQLLCTMHYYRVKPDAEPVVIGGGGAAFQYRRALIVGPQKCGKSPYAASIIAFEAVGPCMFAGWARGGEIFACADWGCDCGFVYEYDRGDPMGQPPPGGKKIQLMATSEDQTANIYDPLSTMARRDPLARVMKAREGFIRLPNEGRIDPVTAAANSKLGNPVAFAVGDESGLYTRKVTKAWETIRRGVTGMGGRTMEITNPWDPMENSTAQKTYNYAEDSDDIFVYYVPPPAKLRFEDDEDRMRILEVVYAHSPWVDLSVVSKECKEILASDPPTAMRFFGNMLVQGEGAFISQDLWDARTTDYPADIATLYDLQT